LYSPVPYFTSLTTWLFIMQGASQKRLPYQGSLFYKHKDGIYYKVSLIAAWAAASLAIGTRKGEQLT
jgi:hypothetical protein